MSIAHARHLVELFATGRTVVPLNFKGLEVPPPAWARAWAWQAHNSEPLLLPLGVQLALMMGGP